METNVNLIKKIGEIGVDAGLCWIGDPCYILHRGQSPRAIGKSWHDFCRILREDDQYPVCKQFSYDLGHPGLGVVVSSGYGDGLYPVFAEFNDEGRIAKVCVEFIGHDDQPDQANDADITEAQADMPQGDFDVPQHILDSLAGKALDAFWQVIVAHYPQADTGDLSPLTTLRLDEAAEAAIREWIYANVPQTANR
jgi:hypothetical protein